MYSRSADILQDSASKYVGEQGEVNEEYRGKVVKICVS